MVGLCIPVPVSELAFVEGNSRQKEAQTHVGREVLEAKTLRELERENTESKKRVADLSLDDRMLKNLNSRVRLDSPRDAEVEKPGSCARIALSRRIAS